MVVWKKNKIKTQSTILLLLLTGSITFNALKTSQVNETERKNEALKQTITLEHNENESLKKENIKVKQQNSEFKKLLKIKEEKHNSIRDKFRKVNPKIDDQFVDLFIDVSDHYGLHPHKNYDLFISQLLVESRGNQFNNDGSLKVGAAGEIGLCQIIPNTALFFMKHKMTEEQKLSMVKLGADDLANITTEGQAKAWLSKRANNVIMWGYIMKCSIKRERGSINDGFVAYNAGHGGLNKFRNNGHNATEHSYYKSIQKMKSRI